MNTLYFIGLISCCVYVQANEVCKVNLCAKAPCYFRVAKIKKTAAYTMYSTEFISNHKNVKAAKDLSFIEGDSSDIISAPTVIYENNKAKVIRLTFAKNNLSTINYIYNE